MKYLGVEISDGKDIFEKQKEKMLEKARKMAKMTYGVIEKKDFLESNSATTHINGEPGGELHAKRYTGPPGHREWGI